MKLIFAVCRHELRLLFYAPLSFLFMGGFLLALAASIFLIADFYSTDEASIHLMLLFAPWVGIVLVPALAMGMWTDEKADKSVELTLSLPVPLTSIVLGKYVAGFFVLMVMLALTFPFPLTVAFLGEPDLMRIAAGYLGLVLLLGFFFAIALFAAALVRDAVGGFVVGLVLLFFVMLLGWDVFTNLMKELVAPEVLGIISLYSPRTWLVRMGDGSIELAGIVYFLTGIGVSLLASGFIISRRRAGLRYVRLAYATGSAIAFVLLASIVPLSKTPLALDWTAENEHSLHAGTQDILGRLPDGIAMDFYWSAGEPTVPVSIKTHARRIRKLLENMVAHSGGRIRLREIDPKPDSDRELRALSSGVRRIPMSSGDHFYLGLVVSHGKKIGSIPYFDLVRDRFLEYDIAVSLNGLAREKTPKIGIISPLLPSSAAVGQRQGMSFLAELKRSYDIAVIPFFKPVIPAGLSSLVIIDASVLRREMLYAIDQFVMGGGSLVVMVDPHVRFNSGSNSVNPSPSDEVDDITDLLLKWGVRYLHEDVVGDARGASPVADSNETRLSFPYWIRIRKSGLSSDHPVSASLNEVFMVDPGALESTRPERVTALVSTSTDSGVQPRQGYSGRSPRELATAFKPDGKVRDIALAINPPFKSAFGASYKPLDNRLAPAKHRTHSIGRPTVFVISDVDWVYDPFSLQRVDLGGQTVVRPLNDNLTFFLNLVEYVAGETALTEIRSRGRLHRPFTRVQDLFQKAQNRFRQEEGALAEKVGKLENKMAAVMRSAGDFMPETLPQSLRKEIEHFRHDLVTARQRLRDVRRLIRAEVEALGRQLTVFNMLSGPIMAAALWLGIAVVRRRRANVQAPL